MKHQHQLPREQNPIPVNQSPLADWDQLEQRGVAFGPSPRDVAKRAYYIFLNQGSLPGFDIQHWQEAEAQLVEERNITLDRGLPKPFKK